MLLNMTTRSTVRKIQFSLPYSTDRKKAE